MSEQTSTVPFSATRHYRLTPAVRWRSRILGTMLLVVSVFLFYNGLDISFNFGLPLAWFEVLFFLISPIFFFALGCMHWYNAERMHLTITAHDFHLHACGYTLTCSWTNVSRIGNRWGEECLFLDQPAETRGPLAWLPRLYQQDRFIYLGAWGQWWGSNQFAQDLRQTIPSIVEAPKRT